MEKTHHSPTTPQKIPLKTWKKVTVLERCYFCLSFPCPLQKNSTLTKSCHCLLLAEAPFVKVRENQNKVLKKTGNKNKQSPSKQGKKELQASICISKLENHHLLSSLNVNSY